MAPWSQTAASDISDLTGHVCFSLNRTIDVMAGQLIVLGVAYSPGEIAAITDDAAGGSNTYVPVSGSAVGPNSDHQSQIIYYAIAKATERLTVTTAFDGSASFCQLTVAAYSGNSIDSPVIVGGGQAQSSPGTDPDGVSSGEITTSADGALIWGHVQVTSGDAGILEGSGFSAVSTGVVGASRAEYRTQETRGSVAATFTMGTNTRVQTAVAAFMPAEAPPVAPEEAVDVTVAPIGFGLTAALGMPSLSERVDTIVSPVGLGMTASLGTMAARTDTTLMPTGFGVAAMLGTRGRRSVKNAPN